MKLISNNKKAYYEYFILEKYEAGIVLTGTEIKSIRRNTADLKDSYVLINNNQVEVVGLHIPKYSNGNIFNHEEKRIRKLLLNKKEILKISQKMKEKGLTLIPLSLYFNENGIAKLEIGLAKGKKSYDKRESIKKREIKIKLNRGDDLS